MWVFVASSCWHNTHIPPPKAKGTDNTRIHPRALRQTGEEAIADIGFAGKTVANGATGLIALIFVLNAIAYTIMRYNKPRYQLLVPPVMPTSG